MPFILKPKSILLTLSVLLAGLLVTSLVQPMPVSLAKPLEGGTEVCGEITSNTTWSQAGSPYLMTCDVNVPTGVILTIESGTVVKGRNNKRLEIQGHLEAQGTAANPITLTSELDTDIFQWDGIYFNGGTGHLNHITIRYGGDTFYNGSPQANIYIASIPIGGEVLIENSQIHYSGSYAISIQPSELHQVRLLNNNFSDTSPNRIEILEGTIISDVSLPPRVGLEAYVLSDNLTVSTGVTLLIEAGTTVMTNNGKQLQIQGHLEAEGTATNPILFTSLTNNDVYQWDGIYFNGGTGHLNHAIVRYGGDPFYNGSPQTNIYIASIPIGGEVLIENSQIHYPGRYAISIESDELHQVRLINNNFNDTSSNRIEIRGGVIVSDASLPSQTGLDAYVSSNNLTVSIDVTLSIEAGTTIMGANDRYIQIEGDLQAIGTASQPILFTSLTNNDVSQWDGIRFNGGTGHLKHVRVRYGGKWSPNTNIHISNTKNDGEVIIENSILEHSGSSGLYVTNGQVSITCTTFSDNRNYGLYIRNSGTPMVSVSNSSFENNIGEGLYNDNATEVNARNNYWGDASGPSGDGPGSGDEVSGNVLYDPWLNAAPTDCDDDPTPPSSLDLAKTVSSTTAQPNDTLTYELSLTANEGSTDVVLEDTIPTGLTYVEESLTGGATYESASRQIRYNGSVSSGTPLVIGYQVTVDADVAPGSILYNAAIATSDETYLEAAVAVSVPESDFDGTLALLYLNGDNNLSEYMLNAINRAEEGASNPNVATLLLLDGPSEGDTYLYRLQEDFDGSCPNYINPTCNGRYVQGQNLWEWQENVSTPYSLAEFLIGADGAYPQARQIVLSLVGHGGGWAPTVLDGQPKRHGGQSGGLGGLLWDNDPGASLSTAELGQALTWFHGTTERKIDLLYLDACLMGMSEVAYEVRETVEYLLASESWSWTSFRYDEHLDDIGASSTARQVGEKWLANEANSLRSDEYPFTYSLLHLSHTTALREAQDSLASELIGVLPSDKDKIDEAFENSACFDSNGDHYIVLPGNNAPAGLPVDKYCDLHSFAEQISVQFSKQQVANAAQELQDAVAAVVVAEAHHNGIPGNYSTQEWNWGELGGVSGYLPLVEDEWRRRYYTGEHLQFAQDGDWDEFLAAYWNNAEPPTEPECPPDCDLPPGPLPIAPIMLQARSGHDSINLNWTLEGELSGDLDHYDIYRSTDGSNGTVIASISNSQYMDNSELIEDIEYCYEVQALDSDDNLIGGSNVACINYGPLYLWVADQIVPPNTTDVLVPINIENGNGLCIGAMDITIDYDPTIVIANGEVAPTIYTAGYSFVANTINPGRVKISSIPNSEECQELYGGGSLFVIAFDIIGNKGQMTVLDFIEGLPNTDIYEKDDLFNPLELALENGSFTVQSSYIRGDTNGDTFVNLDDATLALSIANDSSPPTLEQHNACDMNGDNLCNAADISLILCNTALEDWERCGGSQSANGLETGRMPQNSTVEIAIDSVSQAGQTISVPVKISNALDFAGGDFTFSYDASKMRATGVALTSLTNDFRIGTHSQEAGILRVSLASNESINANGTILQLEFTTTSRPSSIDFGSVKLNDATGRDFEISALQRQMELVSYNPPSVTTIFLPTVIR